MGIFVVTARTGRIKQAVAASPRVVIATDASEANAVPAEVRLAADMISTSDAGIFQNKAADFGADGAIVWVEGDQLLRGASEDLRGAFLSRAPLATLVPVHLPCLPEADLVGLQPRLICAGATGQLGHSGGELAVTAPSRAANVRMVTDLHCVTKCDILVVCRE